MTASLSVIAAVVALLALALIAIERGPGTSKELALVATIGAAAAAGRVLFAPLPSVKPVTTICVVTGAALGARAGLAVGAIAALVSNAFLGQGWWTPAQMLLWGLAGVSGAALRPLARRPVGLAAITCVWGFVFGWAMDLWSLALFGPEVSWASFVARTSTGMWFNTAGAIGNVVFSLTIGPALYRLILRYRARVHVELSEGATA